MAETIVEKVRRVLREFKRYTGDGLPGEPVNAPLPVGDPQSGVNNPSKRELRGALEAVAEAGDRANDLADQLGDISGAVAASEMRQTGLRMQRRVWNIPLAMRRRH